MFRSALITGAALGVLLLASVPVRAQAPQPCTTNPAGFSGGCTAPPDRFDITPTQVRMRNAVGDFVTVRDSAQIIDIAAGSVGDVAGEYVSGFEIPAGTYDAIELTLSDAITMQAQTDGGGSNACFTITGGANPTGPAAPFATLLTADAASLEAALPAGFEVTVGTGSYTFLLTDAVAGSGLPFTIEDGQTLLLDFALGINQSVVFGYASGFCGSASVGLITITGRLSVQ